MKRNLLLALIALLCIPIGIEAKKKEKKEEVPQLLNYPSADMNQLPLHGGEFVIKGRVMGENPKQYEGLYEVIVRDYIASQGDEETVLFNINEDGSFLLNLQLPYPMRLFIDPLPDGSFACPGDTMTIIIDPTKPREEGVTYDATGLSGEVTRLIPKIRKAYCDFSEDYNNREKKTPEMLLKWKEAQVVRLDDVVRKMNAGLPELEGCSPMASDILRTYIISEHMERICSELEDIVDDEELDKRAFWQEYFSFVISREHYLMDNPLLMIGADEFFFDGIMCFLMLPALESLPNPSMNSWKVIKDDLCEYLNLSPADFSIQVTTLRLLDAMFGLYGRNHDKAADDEAIKIADFVAEEVALTLSLLTYPELQRHAVLAYHKYVRAHELKAGEERPVTKGDSIFRRIIEPYKGNVLCVDFWSISCIPCRDKMLKMRDEVEVNKDKPVKYLYITADPEVQCRHFLEPNNIKGEHIYVTKAEWGYLQAKFQFTGIPFIVLFDKNGKQRDDVTVEELLKEQ